MIALLQGKREPAFSPEEPAKQGDVHQDASVHVVANEVSLVELFEALSKMRGIPIDYDRSRLGKKVTIRSAAGLTEEALWTTANRLLQGEGLACIQASGEEGLSIVPLEAAPSLARIDREDLIGSIGGYVKVVVKLDSDPQKVAGSVQKVFEKSGAKVEALGDTGHLMVAGLRPTVEEVMRLVRKLDLGRSPIVVEDVPVEHLTPIAIASLLEQLTQKEKALDKDLFRGSVLARPSTGSLLVVASEEELPLWKQRISELDVPEGVVTRWYVPRRFGLREVGGLLEGLLGRPGGGSGDGPRIVQDELSGSLIVTASESEHLAIEDVFRRLEETDAPRRKELRSFPVRYRDVDELLGILSALVEAGAALPTQDLGRERPGEGDGPAPGGPPQGATGKLTARAAASSSDSEGGSGLSLSADPGSSRILAFGEARLLHEVEDLLQTLDVPRPQVLVEALVVTLSESEIEDLGVELRKAGTSEGTLFELSSLFGLGSPETSAGDISPVPGPGGSGVVLDPGSFGALIHALETRNQGRTLTIPKVLVENHAEASLDSVLHTPYLATSATTTVATTSFGGSEDAGTQIHVTPHIGEGDRLRLEYSVSVSSFVGSPADASLPPPRQENKLEASASLPDGYAVVVGGLEVDSSSKTRLAVPLLGRLPLLGWLFRDDSASRSKSRLFVFLRTSILRSQSFEDLRWASRRPLREAGVADGWPKMRPRIIR